MIQRTFYACIIIFKMKFSAIKPAVQKLLVMSKAYIPHAIVLLRFQIHNFSFPLIFIPKQKTNQLDVNSTLQKSRSTDKTHSHPSPPKPPALSPQIFITPNPRARIPLTYGHQLTIVSDKRRAPTHTQDCSNKLSSTFRTMTR